MPHIVITGASQGIGAALAKAFATVPEARLALVARSEENLNRVAEDCRALGAVADVYPCDITDERAVADMTEAALGKWDGACDAVVNNAGHFLMRSADIEPADFRAQIDVNLTSAFLVTRGFLKPMQRAKSGHVFFIASTAAFEAYPGNFAYVPAKHGLLGLSRALRLETEQDNIRVTCVMPSSTLTTGWQRYFDPEGVPEEGLMKPEDIAQVVLDVFRMKGSAVVEEVVVRPQRKVMSPLKE